MDNRWSNLVSPGPTPVHPVFEDVPEETVPVLRGASTPQQGVIGLSADEGRLGRVLVEADDVFWLGAHGGAGESVLAELFGGTACHHRWPMRPGTEGPMAPVPVFLVARQNRRGLEAASRAARDWASGAHPDVDLQGLVLVADAPGKVPKSLARQTRVISGGVPHTWVVPWIEELRLTGAVDWESMARETRKVLTALGEAVDEVISERTPQ
ncbi:hypothetical protein GMA12_16225 [Kocuria sediminis]|uniref:Uncharacterized protein n=1 Tax=Kocuria sediminis TaxID=1038857 RepID=A0A6N8GPG5_9MICC|nr:DUF6668 family protein [Kocuria sediminis]MUN64669.1 hypothetical protein [Kocuria sediminis]